ncbi:putative Transporter [Pseudomonas syringae pv. papulans]|nr:putative Transporter [Pseudomonas syringae pv. papulans]
MTSIWRTSGWVLLGSALILALSLGTRHGFGLFLAPMSAEFGWGREVFAFAIALQNLMWGLAQPFAGALADRFGAAKVVFVGGVLYAAGLLCMSTADSSLSLSLSAGLLIGIGLSGTSFSVILGVVGRALPAEKRSMGMGIASAAGSFGQFAMLPGTLGLISWLGWSGALLVLGVMVALILPLVGMLKDTPSVSTGVELTLGEALREACSHSGFWLLALGFFVCGFQVVFIGVHLPAYLLDQHLPRQGWHYSAGPDWPVQYLRHLYRRLAGRAHVQTSAADCALPVARGGDRAVSLDTLEPDHGVSVRRGDGLAVAVDRAADQRYGCDTVRCA